MRTKIEMICETCGSKEVLRDAWAEWDEDKQDWVLQNVFDEAFCETCDGSTNIKEREIVQ